MFFRFALVLCCVALGATGLIAEQPKLPKPPSGFKWQWNDEVSGGFLRPNGWYVKSVKQEDTIGLFITKENIDKEGKFKTGLSINVIPRIQKKTGMRASEYVKQFLAESAEGKKVLLDLPPKKP
jgi:hypothetical protein